MLDHLLGHAVHTQQLLLELGSGAHNHWVTEIHWIADEKDSQIQSHTYYQTELGKNAFESLKHCCEPSEGLELLPSKQWLFSSGYRLNDISLS